MKDDDKHTANEWYVWITAPLCMGCLRFLNQLWPAAVLCIHVECIHQHDNFGAFQHNIRPRRSLITFYENTIQNTFCCRYFGPRPIMQLYLWFSSYLLLIKLCDMPTCNVCLSFYGFSWNVHIRIQSCRGEREKYSLLVIRIVRTVTAWLGPVVMIINEWVFSNRIKLIYIV